MYTQREMDEYMKRYERIEEITAMNDSTDGAHKEEMEVTSNESSIKRRKVDSPSPQTLHLSPRSEFQLEIECRRVLKCSLSPAVSENSDRAVSSLCSSNDLSEALIKDRFLTSDLKEESFVTDISKLSNGGFSRETTPSSELSVDSDRMESPTPKKKKSASAGSRQKPTKIPSAVEIEEFFSVAEKYEQKRFSEKYNYDIVKDVPLEGRYQWVKLKP